MTAITTAKTTAKTTNVENDIALWSTSRQALAIRTKEITSRQLLERFIARIEKLNGHLNAVITQDFEAALVAADKADAALSRGEILGPLHGVPITIKDALQVAGMRSTGGATELYNNIPSKDADVVRLVRKAGAIVFGKTNLPRWSGDIQAYNQMFGTTVNPWNAEKVPGGSSGGAAAAVATGLTSFEIGTDIGGSIRIPSSFCGVYGHKPSFGIVPSKGYLDHASGGNDEADINVHGPIARSAEDLELLLGIMLRTDSALVAQLSPAKELGSLRVAAWLDDVFCPVDSEVLAVMNNAVALLSAAGISVDRTARPDIDPREASYLGMSLVSAAMLQNVDEISADTDGAVSAQMSHRQWLDANTRREEIRLKWAQFFDDYDVVLMPVSFVPPFEHNHEGDFGNRTLLCNGQVRPYTDLIRWTTLTGMAYLPASVPPLGLSASGLPIGVQVVGPYGGDLTTIRLAGMMGELCGGFKAPLIAVLP
ncbi:MAG: amidase [Paraglaciecola psychrophila]|jgi:amidase